MTVRKNRHGRWMCDVQIEHADGRVERVRKVAPVQTRREAEAYERELRRAVLDGLRGREEEPEREIPTFAEFAKVFIDTYATTNNRPSTVREKRRMLGRGLLEQLGHLRLDQIGTKEVERFKARRKADGVCNKTINEEVAVLAKALDVANQFGDLPTPPPRMRRLKAQRASFDFFDFEEAERLTEAAKTAGQPWSAMVPLALLTGLRLGELRGLQWDDVDLVGRRLHVRRAADDEGELHPPKSGQSRVVDLPQRAVQILRGHKHLRGPFVFCRDDGAILQRWDCESGSKRERDDSPLMKVCRRAGLRRMGWHGLRHTYASHLVMRGASITEVQQLLGHSTIAMTMIYAHLSPSARRAAVALLDQPAPRSGEENQRHPDGTPLEERTRNGPQG